MAVDGARIADLGARDPAAGVKVALVAGADPRGRGGKGGCQHLVAVRPGGIASALRCRRTNRPIQYEPMAQV